MAELTPLLTAEQAAQILQVHVSWLRRKATARAIACTFIGKHLRFSTHDLEMIIKAGACDPSQQRKQRPTRQDHRQA